MVVVVAVVLELCLMCLHRHRNRLIAAESGSSFDVVSSARMFAAAGFHLVRCKA